MRAEGILLVYPRVRQTRDTECSNTRRILPGNFRAALMILAGDSRVLVGEVYQGLQIAKLQLAAAVFIALSMRTISYPISLELSIWQREAKSGLVNSAGSSCSRYSSLVRFFSCRGSSFYASSIVGSPLLSLVKTSVAIKHSGGARALYTCVPVTDVTSQSYVFRNLIP